MKMVLVI